MYFYYKFSHYAQDARTDTLHSMYHISMTPYMHVDVHFRILHFPAIPKTLSQHQVQILPQLQPCMQPSMMHACKQFLKGAWLCVAGLCVAECVAVCCRVLQCVAVCCMCCSVGQCVVVCCNVLPGVAV